jgi:hypothetical protein
MRMVNSTSITNDGFFNGTDDAHLVAVFWLVIGSVTRLGEISLPIFSPKKGLQFYIFVSCN